MDTYSYEDVYGLMNAELNDFFKKVEGWAKDEASAGGQDVALHAAGRRRISGSIRCGIRRP